MKKFISAVTSLAMTATMASFVAPAAINAADSSKTLTIGAYAQSGSAYASQGSAVTISAADIAAGDVKVPCAVYLSEATNDTQTMAIPLTVDGPDAAAGAAVKFDLIDPAKDYFDSNQPPFDVKNAVVFAAENDELDGYLPTGIFNLTCDTKQEAAGTNNAYIGYGQTFPRGYNWTGQKSDDYPVFVFDVTIPKGATEGTYKIRFCDYVKDAQGNQALMLETEGDRFTAAKGNLVTKEMTIVVGEGGSEVTTTTTATTTTATTTQGGNDESTTTTTTTSGGGSAVIDIPSVNTDAPFVFDFGTYEDVKPGDKVTVDVKLKKGAEGVGSMDVKYTIDSPLTITTLGKKSEAYGVGVEGNLDTLQQSFIALDQSGDPAVGTAGASVFKVVVQVPADCPDGAYKIAFDKDATNLFKSGANSDVWDWGYEGGVIVVGNGGTIGTTTTSATTTTVTTTDGGNDTTTTTVTTTDGGNDTTTTSTTAPTDTTGVPGSKIWGDTNCDGVVNVADVVILNKYNHDSASIKISEQGKINADCFNPKDGAELNASDSEAIIQSIVHLVTLPVEG